MNAIKKPMTLPKFSVRELLLLTTIIALALPYVYRSVFAAHRINLTSSDIDLLVASFEPKARMSWGSYKGGGKSFEIQKSYAVPKSSADFFVQKLKSAMEKHLRYSLWSMNGVGSSSTNGKTSSFSFDLTNGASECVVRCYVLDRETAIDQLDGEVEYIRILVICLQSP